MLGPSESIGTLSESFHQVEKSHKIYCLRPAASTPSLPLREGRVTENRVELRERVAGGGTALEVQREADRLALAEYAPPGVDHRRQDEHRQVRGRTAPYLELSPGEPTQNLLKLAREGLIAGLGKAIRTARRTNAVAHESGFRIEDDGQLQDVTIRVIPFRGSPSSGERYFLILFEEARPDSGPKTRRMPAKQSVGDGARLHRELVATKEYLQSIVEDNAGTLEELRAANEEAQAAQ